MIHIYYGEGKGKTTASIGLAVRAAGAGKRVYIARFLKSKASGEISALGAIPNIELGDCPDTLKFTFCMTENEKASYCEFAEKLLDAAFASGADMIVLDESIGAVSVGVLSLERLLAFLRDCPENREVVLTGRDPSAELLETADYITRMVKIRHPYDSGQPDREGVEY